MPKSASIKDIASALNLSTATVSWVLSGQGDERKISEPTQQRVMEMARQMNYRHNTIAQSLSLGYTRTIGVIVSNIANMFYAELARAIESEAAAHGYMIIVCNSDDDPEKEKNLINMLKSKRVDGIILTSTKQDKSEILKLRREHYPLVLADRYFPELKLNSVAVDNFGGSYAVVRHMVERGYRKIGVISTASHLVVISDRIAGYRKAMADAGLKVRSQWLGTVGLKSVHDDLSKLLDVFLSPPNMVEAIFCTTHFIAMELYSLLNAKGLKIPNSVGVACFDYFDYFAALDPALTSVKQPIDEMGRQAVRLLLAQFEDENSFEKIVLPTELVVGKSC